MKAVKAAAEAFMAKHGVPEIVIGNAGVSHGTLTEFEDDVDVFRQIMDINVNGVVNAFHPFIAPMKARRAGSLVGVASVAGFRGIPGAGAYSASKAGLLGLVRSFSAELAPGGVQVNAICPGWVETDMAWQGIDAIVEATGMTRDEAVAEAMKAVPLGRMGQPEEIAGTVAYLLSPDARGVTGQAIDQNGGAWTG